MSNNTNDTQKKRPWYRERPHERLARLKREREQHNEAVRAGRSISVNGYDRADTDDWEPID